MHDQRPGGLSGCLQHGPGGVAGGRPSDESESTGWLRPCCHGAKKSKPSGPVARCFSDFDLGVVPFVLFLGRVSFKLN